MSIQHREDSIRDMKLERLGVTPPQDYTIHWLAHMQIDAFVHLLTVKNRCRSVFYQCHAGTSLHVVRCSENAFDFGFRFLLNLFHVWPCRHFACAMFQVPCIMSVCLNGHFYG